MQLSAFEAALREKKIDFRTGEPMNAHTTFRIGGNADVFVLPENASGLRETLAAAKACGVPCFCLGKGSDLLVSDRGIAGAVISLSALCSLSVSGSSITCGAGAPLSALCCAARDAGLTGLEFAFGIPGSVGGALFMNAGAYGGEMSQVVVSAECADASGAAHTLTAGEMALGYRTSVFSENGLFITSVTVTLSPGDRAAITAKMEELMNRRREKQPLELPSAGSVFKRPAGYYAGALIEKNGLKGLSCGGAAVSEKHAGFIVNTGGASASDVLALIGKIQEAVRRADGVELEPEIRFVGRK